MDTYSFFRGSNTLDLIAIFLIFFVSFCLVITQIGVLIWAKKKKWLYIFILLSVLPLAIGIFDGAYRYIRAEQALRNVYGLDASSIEMVRAEIRSEFLIMTILGLAGTAPPLILAGAGLVFKKDKIPQI